ncbi:MAG: family 10 glycosylhydrolase [Bacteroidales bacterium]|nr:family 10 glycosylhydrolase [Bacteroidales bacterium]
MNSLTSKTTVLASLILLFSCLQALSQGNGQKVFNPETDSISLVHEFRGAWLTTVKGYDWPKGITINLSRLPGENGGQYRRRVRMQRDSQQTALVNVIRQIHETGCNVVILQLCCNSEVFYKSDILPWDHNLTGVQGEDPGYDPLQLAIETAHSLGMQIHGWFNPMRVGFVTNERTPDHLCFRHPERVQTYGNVMYWDPGNPEVISYLYELIYEVMSKYDLDGAHIDDFFYPAGLRDKDMIPILKDSLQKASSEEEKKSLEEKIAKLDDGKIWDDSELFSLYGNGLDLAQWRESNVNKIISAMYKAVHDAKPDAVFGVSPRGRIEHTKRLYADPRWWIQEKTIDYLAPQIYWTHSDKENPFYPVLYTWEKLMDGVPALPGLASYLYGKEGFESMGEYHKQVDESRQAPFVCGNIWFSSSDMFPDSFTGYAREKIYPYRSLVPILGTSTFPAPKPPVLRYFSGGLKWNRVPDADSYAVYKLEEPIVIGQQKEKLTWKANLILVTDQNRIKNVPAGNYIVVSRRGKMISSPSNVVCIEN